MLVFFLWDKFCLASLKQEVKSKPHRGCTPWFHTSLFQMATRLAPERRRRLVVKTIGLWLRLVIKWGNMERLYPYSDILNCNTSYQVQDCALTHSRGPLLAGCGYGLFLPQERDYSRYENKYTSEQHHPMHSEMHTVFHHEVSPPSASCARCFPPFCVRLLKETSRSGDCPL